MFISPIKSINMVKLGMVDPFVLELDFVPNNFELDVFWRLAIWRC